MNALFQKFMQKAMGLTRGGDLKAATEAIQQALQPAAPTRREDAAAQDDVIDVVAREVGTTDAGTTDAAPSDAGTSDAGSFIAGNYGTAIGQRNYKLYIPPQAGGPSLPLLVMLHGCTQNPDDFAAGTAMNELARAQGFYVLYPAQSQQANPQRCWNWFKHNHQERDRGEPALLAGMTRQVMAQHGIDPTRVYVAGLSAGGAMAAILGDVYPDLYAAVGVHSGLAAGAANTLESAFGAMKSGPQGIAAATRSGIPTIVFHGDGDQTVHPVNAEHVIAASVEKDAQVELSEGRSVGGRSYTREIHRSASGKVLAERWVVHGAPHAWSGGCAAGSYTDPMGPDASAEMVRFFLATRLGPAVG
jgi:poly(hydroxyalkanoate) depolymerase family esterase